MKKLLIQFVESCTSRKGRWMTLAIWIILVGVLSSVFPNVNKVTNNGADNLPKEKMSVQAEKIAKEQYPNETGTPLLLVWYRNGGLIDEDYSLISELYQGLDKNPLPQQSFIPPLGTLPPQALAASLSEDGTSLVTPVFMEKNATTDELVENKEGLEKKLVELEGKSVLEDELSKSGLHVRFTGPVGIATDADELFSRADVALLIATVLIVLVLLILLYRSPILAIVPLIGVGFAYGVTSPILGFLAEKEIIIVDSQALSIMTVLLFGAGTDYCLFLVAKYRECLLYEEDKIKALQKAIKHSGGAIFVSAITVVLSLCTLLLAQYGSYVRFAIPFSLVILIMGLVALTLLPALLSIFGRASFFPFIPRTEEMIQALEAKKGRKIRRRVAHSKFNQRLGNFVTSKPWTVIIVSIVFLGILASFYPKIQYTQNLLASFPEDMDSREGFTLIGDHFSEGELAPITIIVDSEGKELNLKGRLSDLSFIDSVSDPIKGKVNEEYLSYSVNLNMDPYSTEAVENIPEIKKEIISSLKDAGVEPGNYWIGGETSKYYDTEEATSRDMVVIAPVVIAIIAGLLLMYLRSIVAMIYLILTVVLSYLSALGAGWVFLHYGMGTEAISALIPLYAFVFLVALGEDYNIFMVSSIWKNRKIQPHRQAIANGVTETSSVITSAGLILAGTFAVLATLPIQVLLQFGIITAIGVLLDTFIVRPLLVPAITTVLGRYAFWPGSLWKVKEDSAGEELEKIRS